MTRFTLTARALRRMDALEARGCLDNPFLLTPWDVAYFTVCMLLAGFFYVVLS